MVTLSPEGFDDPNVLTAHTTMFVTKAWISSNQIHEWSIQFSRFDEEQEAWRPSTTKRVGEDAERVFFSVGIPGFSMWAITEEAGEYNAILFVNDQVKKSARVPLDANGVSDVAFEVAPNIAGEYGVRVDRLLGSFTVVPVLITPTVVPPTVVPPTVTPPTPTPIAVVPRERGPGFPIGIILGVLTAIAVAAAGIAYYLRGRELPPPPPAAEAAPPEEERPQGGADEGEEGTRGQG